MKFGNLVILAGLILALASGFSYYLAAKEGRKTLRLARRLVYAMTSMLVLSSGTLMYLILTHEFQFSYVYRYTSSDLPLGYLISGFWAGQEGTFLLWALLTGLLSIIFIRTARQYEALGMQVILLVEVFFFALLMKNSPFELLGRIPAEGAGLNPLLQDPWMVVHPPILFVGYAALSFPFATGIVALLKREYSGWVNVALPWTLFGSFMLGAGIVIGGYWAYEVLGWGGYWGWDPVENSSLVPWLTAIALFHGLLVQRTKGTLQRTNLFLALITFLLILYATFLTRSGILADFSVHSFQDNGANLYLTLFILASGGFSLGLLGRRFRKIPRNPIEFKVLTRDNALTLSILALSVSALFISVGTSSPLITGLITLPSQVDISFYNKVNIPIAMVIGLLLGLTPSLGWSPVEPKLFLRRVGIPFALSLGSALVGLLLGVRDVVHLLYIWTISFAIWGNFTNLVRQTNLGWLTLGAPVSHLGFGLMLVGVLASSAYDSEESVALARDVPGTTMDLTLTYLGRSPLPSGKEALDLELTRGGEVLNSRPKYYYSEYNRAMMREPAIERAVLEDLYISPLELREVAVDRPALDNLVLRKGEEKLFGEYAIRFVGFEMSSHESGGAIRVGAQLAVNYRNQNFKVVPALLITPDGKTAESVPLSSDSDGQSDLVALNRLDADNKFIELVFSGRNAATREVGSELLTVEVSRKPLINLVWLGTILFSLGLALASVRRSLNGITS